MLFEVSVLSLRKYDLLVFSLHGLFTDLLLNPSSERFIIHMTPTGAGRDQDVPSAGKQHSHLGHQHCQCSVLSLCWVLSHISLNSKWRLEGLQKGYHEGKSRKTWWQQHDTHLQPHDVFTEMCRKHCRCLPGNRRSHLLSYVTEKGGLHGFKRGCLWHIFK